ncbi:hypothetical protein L3Q82_026140 [Scortum barcoo]|uniref:Uncharacterized protein n=1 Tax=Scortum barcoo TaxID=214431 RepID=A0ACB8WNM5_9TELE|nr:hypothetical protein L3Q82_026140 [Scortum barcoo]
MTSLEFRPRCHGDPTPLRWYCCDGKRQKRRNSSRAEPKRTTAPSMPQGSEQVDRPGEGGRAERQTDAGGNPELSSPRSPSTDSSSPRQPGRTSPRRHPPRSPELMEVKASKQGRKEGREEGGGRTAAFLMNTCLSRCPGDTTLGEYPPSGRHPASFQFRRRTGPAKLNDFRPVALTSHLMKTLERLFLSLLRPQVQHMPRIACSSPAYQPGVGVWRMPSSTCSIEPTPSHLDKGSGTV